MGSVFSRLSEIPCLLTRVITNTKGSICPPAIRGEVQVGPSAAGRPREGKQGYFMHEVGKAGRERVRPATRLRPRMPQGYCKD